MVTITYLAECISGDVAATEEITSQTWIPLADLLLVDQEFAFDHALALSAAVPVLQDLHVAEVEYD